MCKAISKNGKIIKSMQEEKKLTKISELGEFGLIDKLTNDIRIRHKSTIKGVGDDAAVIDCGGKYTVITTDLLAEGVHFNLMYTPLKHLGYKAVVVNLSDVYSMNAIPKQITVSIAVSNKFAVENINELYDGIKLACEKYNIDLIGGDTSSSLTGLTISITAIGEVKKENITYRNSAKENNILCVSGDLGSAYMGLQLLEREKEIFKANPEVQPELQGNDYILERQLKPEARKDIIEFFQEEKIIPTSMIDISDGLSSEILHICKNSDLGCKIFLDKLPIDANTSSMAKEFKIEPEVAALNGGEDYELLFTINPDDFEKIKDSDKIHAIGHMTSKDHGAYMIPEDGEAIKLVAQGWKH
jgi:thiamine-monophosphate kinase